MKKLLLFLVLLLAGNTAFAQDYAPLPDTGIRRYFTNSAGYLRGIRVDSVVQEAGYKRYVTFRTPRNVIGGGFPSFTDSTGACWLGKNVRAYPNGDWQFPNHAGDTITIKIAAALNDSWTFYSDTTSRWFEAKVSSIDTQTVFGRLDSVKIIELTAKSGNTPLPADPITGFKLALSKHYGFAQVPDLYLFPYAEINTNHLTKDYWYQKMGKTVFLGNEIYTYNPTEDNMIFRNISDWVPNYRKLVNYETGDVVLNEGRVASCSGNYNISRDYALDAVIARQDFATTTTYTMKGWVWRRNEQNRLSTLPHERTYTFNVVDSTLYDSVRIPEEYGFNYRSIYVLPKDTSFCRKGVLIMEISNEGSGLSINFPCYPIFTIYKNGLGKVFYRRSGGFGEGSATFMQLLYFKDKKISCGIVPVVPLEIKNFSGVEPIFKLYPQPATTEIFLEAPGLRYPATIRIQSLQGQLLSTQQITAAGKPVSTANLPAGLYLLSVTDAGGNSGVQKLLIETR